MKNPRELDAGSLTVLKLKSMENLRDLMQVKLIFTYIFCLRLLGPEQNDILTKFSCILFRKLTFKTAVIILYGYCNPYYLLKLQ